MKHARPDYDRIQDPHHLIPENEPVFLLRGQDELAPEVLDLYATLAESHHVSPALITLVRRQATAMRIWQKEHANKLPDLPKM